MNLRPDKQTLAGAEHFGPVVEFQTESAAVRVTLRGCDPHLDAASQRAAARQALADLVDSQDNGCARRQDVASPSSVFESWAYRA